jgi:hypothetical protein
MKSHFVWAFSGQTLPRKVRASMSYVHQAALFMVCNSIRMQHRFGHLWISLTYLLFSLFANRWSSLWYWWAPQTWCSRIQWHRWFFCIWRVILSCLIFVELSLWMEHLVCSFESLYWKLYLYFIFTLIDGSLLLLEVMRGLHNLFLETLDITYMHIGWFFVIQQQTRWLNKSPVLLVLWSPWLVQ